MLTQHTVGARPPHKALLGPKKVGCGVSLNPSHRGIADA